MREPTWWSWTPAAWFPAYTARSSSTRRSRSSSRTSSSACKGESIGLGMLEYSSEEDVLRLISPVGAAQGPEARLDAVGRTIPDPPRRPAEPLRNRLDSPGPRTRKDKKLALSRQETPQEDAEEEAQEAVEEDPVGASPEIGGPAQRDHLVN